MTSSSDPQSASPDPSESPTAADSDLPHEDIDRDLSELEDGIVALRKRYTEVAAAYPERQELKVRLNRAQSELKRHRTQAIQDEVNALQARLTETELTLESALFSWSSLKEPFWMAVRFGGLGMVLGWVLHALR